MVSQLVSQLMTALVPRLCSIKGTHRSYHSSTQSHVYVQALEWLFSVTTSSVTNGGMFVNNEVQEVFLVSVHLFK